jgi:hypothetical protein
MAQEMWTRALPPALVRFIGVSELAGALGLIMPAITRIKPRLTPLAAAGLVLVMIFAAAFHILRGELGALLINATLGSRASSPGDGCAERRFKPADWIASTLGPGRIVGKQETGSAFGDFRIARDSRATR